MDLAITTAALRKEFGACTAVDGVTFEVEVGTVFGLIGANGSGKTTTLRMLLDIIRPTSGSIEVLGQDPRQGGASLRKRIGFLPGELRLEGRATGRQILDFYGSVSGPIVPGAVEQLTERFGVDLDRPVGDLSRGNKQKVGLIQAFMHEPELLILDEPTSGLDPLMKREFIQLVREARDNGQTVLLSTHILSEIQQCADSVLVLNKGRAVANGDVESLRLTSIRYLHAGISGAQRDVVQDRLTRIGNVRDVETSARAGGGIRLAATVDGPVDDLMKALAEFTITDITIDEPDLEESVLSLYEKPVGGGHGA